MPIIVAPPRAVGTTPAPWPASPEDKAALVVPALQELLPLQPAKLAVYKLFTEQVCPYDTIPNHSIPYHTIPCHMPGHVSVWDRCSLGLLKSYTTSLAVARPSVGMHILHWASECNRSGSESPTDSLLNTSSI